MNQTIQNRLNYQYKLLEESSIQNAWCYALTFNKSASILAVAWERYIKMFQFLNGEVEELQLIEAHESRVTCLQFMKKDNTIVSGSLDNTIKIWQQQEINKWILIQTLEENTNWIGCLIINNNDDLIISGSVDNSIKFYNIDQNNIWNIQQTIQENNDRINSLSLNQSQNKLISSGRDKLILIIEYQENKQWIIKQKIELQQFVYRLSFINDEQFIILPKLSQFIILYQFDIKNQKFHQAKEIKIQKTQHQQDDCLFPILLNHQKQIIILKNGSFLNIILYDKENQDFQIQQTIEYQTHQIFGTVTDDGNYLVTWNKESSMLQIRQLIENLETSLSNL